MISAADVRNLLDGTADAVLVVVGGRAAVVGTDELGSRPYRGALQVISRAELVERSGDELSDRQLEEQAATLDTVVSELGG